MVSRRKSLQSFLRAWSSLAREGVGAVLPIILAIGATAILLPVSISRSAELSRSSEYELKAAFLFNFIKFTEWPPMAAGKKDGPFVVGVVGKDPFGSALDRVIEGENFRGKTIVARRFPRMDEAAAGAQVLFISASEEANLAAILKLLDGHAILTVSEIEHFAERGGIIKLKKENNKIAFEINLDAARRAGLAMNAQLLKLAKIVKTQS